MRREKHIQMIIRSDGTCAIDAVNFRDGSCQQATEQIAAALAGRTIRTHQKPDGFGRLMRDASRWEAEP